MSRDLLQQVDLGSLPGDPQWHDVGVKGENYLLQRDQKRKREGVTTFHLLPEHFSLATSFKGWFKSWNSFILFFITCHIPMPLHGLPHSWQHNLQEAFNTLVHVLVCNKFHHDFFISSTLVRFQISCIRAYALESVDHATNWKLSHLVWHEETSLDWHVGDELCPHPVEEAVPPPQPHGNFAIPSPRQQKIPTRVGHHTTYLTLGKRAKLLSYTQRVFLAWTNWLFDANSCVAKSESHNAAHSNLQTQFDI